MTLRVLLIGLAFGAVSGWLAGVIVNGGGLGLIGNIIVGILGSALASYLLPIIGVHVGSGLGAQIFNAAAGGVIVLMLLSFVRRR